MIKNIITNWAEIIFTTLSVFILYPFLVDIMGEAQYGIWLLIASLTGYFNLLQIGIPASVVRHISKYYTQKDYTKVNAVLNTSLGMFLSLSIIVLVSGVIIALLVDNLFKIPNEFLLSTRIAIIIVSINIAIAFVFEVLEGVMHAFQNFVVLNSIKIGLLFAKVAVTFLFVTYNNGLLALAIILMSITVTQGLMLIVYIKKRYRFLNFDLKLFNKPILKEIFQYSFYALMLQMASRVAFQTDPMVIGAVISTSAIVFFSLGNNFLIYLMEFVRGIARALMPKSSQMDAQNKTENLKHIYINYSKITYLIVLLASLIFLFLGKDFIGIWMGENFKEPAGNVLIILTISYLFFLVQRGVGHPILMGVSKLKFATITMIITAILNLLISIVLGKYYGINGVAWGTTIPNLLNTIIMIYYTTRFLDINMLYYIYKTIILPSFSAIFFVVPILLIKNYLIIDTYLKFFTVTFIAATVYLVFVIFIFIGNDNRNNVLKLIERLRN